MLSSIDHTAVSPPRASSASAVSAVSGPTVGAGVEDAEAMSNVESIVVAAVPAPLSTLVQALSEKTTTESVRIVSDRGRR